MMSRRERTMIQSEKRLALVCSKFDTNSKSEIEEVVAYVFQIQNDIEKDIEEKWVLLLRSEHDFDEIRKPICDARRDVIKSIPSFWKNVFLNHPRLGGFVTTFDEKIFENLISLEVGKHQEGKDGYSILFEFRQNDYIKNEKIAKNFAVYERGTIITVSTKKIEWETASVEEWERENSFFSWFDDIEPLHALGKVRDQYADIIKYELWKDPGHYYYIEKGQEKDVSSPIMDTDLPLVEASKEGKEAEETMKQIQDRIDEIYKQERTAIETIEGDFIQKLKMRCDARNKLLQQLPQFWYKAFMAHPVLSSLLNVTDETIFRESLVSIEVEYKSVAKLGYSIIFNFEENEYFYNKHLDKDFTLHEGVTIAVKSTVIEWKKGEPVPNKSEKDKNNKQPLTIHSFFNWFHTSSKKEELKRDQVAGIIVNMWFDPIKYLHKDLDDIEDEDDEVKRRRMKK